MWMWIIKSMFTFAISWKSWLECVKANQPTSLISSLRLLLLLNLSFQLSEMLWAHARRVSRAHILFSRRNQIILISLEIYFFLLSLSLIQKRPLSRMSGNLIMSNIYIYNLTNMENNDETSWRWKNSYSFRISHNSSLSYPLRMCSTLIGVTTTIFKWFTRLFEYHVRIRRLRMETFTINFMLIIFKRHLNVSLQSFTRWWITVARLSTHSPPTLNLCTTSTSMSLSLISEHSAEAPLKCEVITNHLILSLSLSRYWHVTCIMW